MDRARPSGPIGPRRKLAITVVVLLALTGLAGTTMLAVFTDTATSVDNRFATGNVDLTVAPTSAALTLTGMAPGARLTSPIDVTNSGSLDLRYAVTSGTDENVLANALRLKIKSGVGTCDAAGFDAGGTTVYGPGPLGATVPVDVIGDPAQGGDLGDRVLNAGDVEQLCFDVTLPSTAGNAVEGLSTTATVTFEAEQTIANP